MFIAGILLVPIIIVFILNPCGDCETPIRTFLLVTGTIIIVANCTNLLAMRLLSPGCLESEHLGCVKTGWMIIRILLFLFAFAWLLVGSVWI